VASAAALSAQTTPNVTGSWAGSFVLTIDGQTREDAVHFAFKQAGQELTGTGGPNAEMQWPIMKGGRVTTAKGVTTLTFGVQENDSGPVFQFELKLVQGRLKGSGKAEQGERKATVVVDVGRTK
jgi:hypothetical protein